jgi:hypothetical protein
MSHFRKCFNVICCTSLLEDAISEIVVPDFARIRY